MKRITLEQLERAFKDHIPRSIEAQQRIPSAVLVPFLEKAEEIHLLFMRKAEDGSLHGGQVSFPGGAYEEEDKDLLSTALRETWEEIGAPPSAWEILGSLTPVKTRGTSFVIHPFVAYLREEILFTPNPKEVAAIFTVPLNYILERHPFKPQKLQWKGKDYTTFLIHYQGEIIWGATARILDQLCNIIKAVGPSSDVAPRKATPPWLPTR